MIWVIAITVGVILAVTITALRSENTGPKVAWWLGVALFIGLIATGIAVAAYSPPFQGTGTVIGKHYQESYRKWSPATKTTRTYPECWAVTIRPDIEPKTEPEHHIAGICIDKASWDKVELDTPITVNRN